MLKKTFTTGFRTQNQEDLKVHCSDCNVLVNHAAKGVL